MSNLTASSEFTLLHKKPSDQRSPLRWIFSHALRHWYLIVSMLVGALGNAGLAALVPVYIGQAFNAINQPVPDTAALLPIALIIGGTQILRGVLQFGRNFSAELIGQRMERDTREELYVSLLGKSMTFHSLQPVGDTMARATNDVREINFLFSPGLNLVIGSATFM
ncbi:MAG: ABC transporter transmembrane domain-containing protein, partial [Anaerolineales bacterium]|nr:ABC transporter transmembrane domain-containing protein [Anaerolineales bacterium]